MKSINYEHAAQRKTFVGLVYSRGSKEINVENDLIELIRTLRALIKYVKDKKYEIICNLTSGTLEMRLALYIAAQIQKRQLKEVFYFNKQDLTKNSLFNLVEPRNKGQELINIMYKE
ncbi:unnamed protein product, partial [marine sediment metagenome]